MVLLVHWFLTLSNPCYIRARGGTTGLNVTGSALVPVVPTSEACCGLSRLLVRGTSNLGLTGSPTNPVVARAGGELEPQNHRNHRFFIYIECLEPTKITLFRQQGLH